MIAGLLASLLAAVNVGGTGTCPRPADVQARLTALYADPGPDHQATIEELPEGVHVALRDADGHLLAERTLPRARCEDLVAAAAVVIAAWEVNFRAADLVAPELRAAPAKEVLTHPEPPPSPPSRSGQWEIGIGLLASFDFGTSSSANAPPLGGEALVAFTPKDVGWGGQFGVSALGSHFQPLGQDSIASQRYDAFAGAHRRVLADPVRVDVEANALAALLWMQSQGGGSLSPATARTFDPGLSVGARAGATIGPLLVWFQAAFEAWPYPHDVEIQNVPGSVRLPQFEVLIVQGLAFGR